MQVFQKELGNVQLLILTLKLGQTDSVRTVLKNRKAASLAKLKLFVIKYCEIDFKINSGTLPHFLVTPCMLCPKE